MMNCSGPPHARAAADSVLAFETRLAEVWRTPVQLRDEEANYNKNNAGRTCPALTPNFKWDAYLPRSRFRATKPRCWFASRSFSSPSAPAWLRAAGRLAELPRWHLVSETAAYLSKPFLEERFPFYGKKLSGAMQLRPRWKRVLAAEDAAIGEDLGQLYVRKAFSPAAKARALTMVNFCRTPCGSGSARPSG